MTVAYGICYRNKSWITRNGQAMDQRWITTCTVYHWGITFICSNYLSTLQLRAGVIPRVDIQNGQAQDRVTDICTAIIYLHFSYELELFPGLIYRMVRPRIVLLIFVQQLSIYISAMSQSYSQGWYTEWSSLGSCYWFTVIIYLHFSYEPELFPGLIYRMVKPRIVLLIYSNYLSTFQLWARVIPRVDIQ